MSTLVVTGTVTREGGFRPGWWSTTPEPPPATPAESGWAVATLDHDGHVLSTTDAVITEARCAPDEGLRTLRTALALPDDAAVVVVEHVGAETYRRLVPPPAAPPRLDFGDVADALATRSTLHIRVDVDGLPGPGAHLIGLWDPPSLSPVPLGLVDLESTAAPVFDVDLTRLPGGENCRFRLRYNDGVRSTEVTSGPLSVPIRPAAPVIDVPTPEQPLLAHGWLTLRGRLGGDGDPDALEWLLDGIVIGRGPRAGHARPAAGAHVLQLRHGEESASMPLIVAATPEPAPPDPWQPPWRTRETTVYGRSLPPEDFGNRRG